MIFVNFYVEGSPIARNVANSIKYSNPEKRRYFWNKIPPLLHFNRIIKEL